MKFDVLAIRNVLERYQEYVGDSISLNKLMELINPSCRSDLWLLPDRIDDLFAEEF